MLPTVDAMRHVPAGDDFDGWVEEMARPQRRQQAKRHLMRAGAPALPALRRGVHHDDVMVRRTCVSILDHLVDDESLPQLVEALDDPDPEVCKRALHALACDQCKEGACRPGEDLFVPRAIEIARGHANPDLRAGAIDTLGKVVHRGDVVAALALVADHDPDPGLRSMAAQRLRKARRQVGSVERNVPTSSA